MEGQYEELDAAVRLRGLPTAGEGFARKVHLVKAAYSREPVLKLYQGIPGPVHLLTLPGLSWGFERSLVARRGSSQPTCETYFTCVESDPAIYRVSLAGKLPQATFEHTTVERLIAREEQDFTGAWLDFNGPLSPTKLLALERLWLRIEHSLVVTFMSARYHADIGALAMDAGGWQELLMDRLRVPAARSDMMWYASKADGHHHVNRMLQVTLRRKEANNV